MYPVLQSADKLADNAAPAFSAAAEARKVGEGSARLPIVFAVITEFYATVSGVKRFLIIVVVVNKLQFSNMIELKQTETFRERLQ